MDLAENVADLPSSNDTIVQRLDSARHRIESADDTLRLWNMVGEREVARFIVDASVSCFGVSPDGSKVVVGASKRTLA